MESRYSETLNGWSQSDEKAPRKAFSLASGMFSFCFDSQSHRIEPAEDLTGELENQLLPDFVESQFQTAARRQGTGPNQELKTTSSPSRFPHIGNEWEVSGWGSVSCLELTMDELHQAHARLNQPERQMGQFRSSSLSGNGIVGSAFYTFPAMAAVASIFSPLSLLIASLIMTIYRPILLELGSAFRLNGTNYVYLLQCSGRTLAAIGATATLLDAVAASVVSAAAAGAYVKAEFPGIPATDHTIGIYLLIVIALLALVTLRESGKLTLVITVIHMIVMAVLMVGSAIAWTHTGTDMIHYNWELRPRGGAKIVRSIYIGVCVGITGFECSPGYIQSIKPGSYGHALRNLLIMSLLLNVPLVLLVYALLPNEVIMRTDNLLAILAEVSFGKPMRIVIVVDCLLVFSVGVFAGVSTGCNLVEALARERVLPQIFLHHLPLLESTYLPVVLFVAISMVVYFSSAFSLSTVSTMVSAAFVSTMLLYSLSCLLLKFSLDRLPRAYRTSMWMTILGIVAMIAILIGNIIQDPRTLGLFALCFALTLLGVFIPNSRFKLARMMLWSLDQTKVLHKWNLDRFIVRWMKHFRKHPVVLWVKDEHINHLMRAISYIQANEVADRLIVAHAYRQGVAILELQSNVRLLEELFPTITIDLIFIRGAFSPVVVEATSQALSVPRSRMFISCPGKSHPWQIGEYRGVRLIGF
ncbi:unnamed protein product [Rhizoctonia solani]|uniref:AAAP amino acid permease n=1 Tax=Rhizoctonia solani TaxID=456999 RepID=A0A8H3DLX4_9AGAM|nr:unnamed protein product [Rhizoctonia solani]